jgi:Ca2+-binding RTX toxin-like protein
MFRTLKSWLTADRTSPKPHLALTALEAREVPATFSHLGSDGVVRITADSRGATVEVRAELVYPSNPYAKPTTDLVVASRDADGRREHRFGYWQVAEVEFNGQGGDDTFTNFTARRCRAYGNSGVDTLTGGRGDDALYGGRGDDTVRGGDGHDTVYGDDGTAYTQALGGRDTLSGGAGNDTLYGEAGADTLMGDGDADQLFGGNGEDTLLGGAGNDRLFGDLANSYDPATFRAQETHAARNGWADRLEGGGGNDLLLGEGGNDTLYGQADNDRLFGGHGNDGLFGGSHYDELSGERGADRLLVWEARLTDQAYHVTFGVQVEDAVVRFRDGAAGTYKNTAHTAGSWAGDEVEAIDVGLKWLHDRTRNTTLLERATGSDLVFVRLGGNNFEASAWNAGRAELIYCPDNMFADRLAGTAGITVHEVAHNWDTENPRWTEFMAVSGWTQTPQTGSGWSKGGDDDEDWWYRTDSETVSTYARWNPREDFAESLQALFEGNTSAIPRKAAVLNAWLDDISG